MRPQILYPLFTSVSILSGLGRQYVRRIEQFIGPHVIDLLWHLPAGIIDRRFSPTIKEASAGDIVTVTVQIASYFPSFKSGQPCKVRCYDDTGTLDLIFFHTSMTRLAKRLPIGKQVTVSGRIEYYKNHPQIVHPDHISTTVDQENTLKSVEPVYPLTAGLPLKTLQRAIRSALDTAPDLCEWLDPTSIAQHGWPSWYTALTQVHNPQSAEDLSSNSPARSRLAFDELLAGQLALGLVRRTYFQSQYDSSIMSDGRLCQHVREILPFTLTGSQEQTIAEITKDLASDRRMLRLLQGDVGSGKTIVAFLAMVTVVESGFQAALMVPTELLARQHYELLSTFAEQINIRIGILTGRDKGRERRTTLAALAQGQIDIIVGTHTLFQQTVTFHALGLAVIDEQHRFGVHQRLILSEKGQGANMLVMTATPIPRTLALTLYGDMDQSCLLDKPPGRHPIETCVLPLERLDEVIDALARQLDQGAQIYWVCPVIEESVISDIGTAQQRYTLLHQRFGPIVGLLHGRMKAKEKYTIMTNFALGHIRLLVSTTVIEVGIDVPTATIMVIEHAERFGLAQLHQLRGRIGRSARQSSCLLMYDPSLGDAALMRLQVMRETEDGFRIAEEDLKLRGTGEILGTKQSGMPTFRIADLGVHGALLEDARDAVRLVLLQDPGLTLPYGKALRVLLSLFERDAAVRYLGSG